MMVGGNKKPPESAPYSSMITSGTHFDNIVALPGRYPNPAAVALANTEGSSVLITNFSDDQLLVVQPYIGDDGHANAFNLSKCAPRVFNISEFTAIFGELYEIEFYNRNAYEENEYSAALRTILVYQGYAFVGLLIIMMVVHQDIVYYVIVRAKQNSGKKTD